MVKWLLHVLHKVGLHLLVKVQATYGGESGGGLIDDVAGSPENY